MEFESYGLEVYTSEVYDHVIDFIEKDKKGVSVKFRLKQRLKKDMYLCKTNPLLASAIVISLGQVSKAIKEVASKNFAFGNAYGRYLGLYT
jgi:hypothetical protein